MTEKRRWTPARILVNLPVAPGTVDDRAWMRRAQCRGCADPERFFPHRNTGPPNRDYIRAVLSVRAEFCSKCPVQQECLTAARPHGIWGGLSEDERDELKRGRRP